MEMNQLEECARCKRKFPLASLQVLEITNESFRRFAMRKPEDQALIYPENETLAELGLDSSMLYCDDCKVAFLFLLIFVASLFCLFVADLFRLLRANRLVSILDSIILNREDRILVRHFCPNRVCVDFANWFALLSRLDDVANHPEEAGHHLGRLTFADHFAYAILA